MRKGGKIGELEASRGIAAARKTNARSMGPVYRNQRAGLIVDRRNGSTDLDGVWKISEKHDRSVIFYRTVQTILILQDDCVVFPRRPGPLKLPKQRIHACLL